MFKSHNLISKRQMKVTSENLVNPLETKPDELILEEFSAYNRLRCISKKSSKNLKKLLENIANIFFNFAWIFVHLLLVVASSESDCNKFQAYSGREQSQQNYFNKNFETLEWSINFV